MKKLLLFLLATLCSTAQNIELQKVGVKPAKYEVFWGNDISGNTYFSTSNNLFKSNTKDTLNYTNNKFGKTNVCNIVLVSTPVIFPNLLLV